VTHAHVRSTSADPVRSSQLELDQQLPGVDRRALAGVHVSTVPARRRVSSFSIFIASTITTGGPALDHLTHAHQHPHHPARHRRLELRARGADRRPLLIAAASVASWAVRSSTLLATPPTLAEPGDACPSSVTTRCPWPSAGDQAAPARGHQHRARDAVDHHPLALHTDRVRALADADNELLNARHGRGE
jgi:hypothetical protein